ncbi:exosome RNA helicase MTR4 [Skeletonema marinoi]|uniref:Exosome RNA helicase MTR4 n=1 Tax=Skeletonema marinoi TaxID=267567 RepID=A0AAD8Y9Q0_9STRA|nr:exosome RNA helicase MTR4 [Skeletonema marinoi]
MADDLDALFGAFDGDDDNQESDEIKVESSKKQSDDEEEQSEIKKRKVDDGEEDAEMNDVENTDAGNPHKKSSAGDAKAVSSMYADVFSQSSMQHAVGHAKKKELTGGAEKDTKKAEGTEGANTATATDASAPADDDNREVSTGTSHDKSIRSYSAIPEGPTPQTDKQKQEEADIANRPPAKVYPFTLDPFQQTAIGYVERNESVLVAAHTSAGKTVVAEYAIAKSLRDGQRVVYTSPIKALSNQKYRDLQEEFEDVGLMTGDITINPSATCLVMTTEILRSMLYRGSEVMREVAWVIYDEVHYMRDKERGVVWEESIILLPHKVRFVFLSATIPNARQFVSWIAKIHHQPCHVVYTNYRPTPLQHYIFPGGGDGLHLVVDEKGKFREVNFQKAMSALQGGGGTDGAIADAMMDSGGGKGGARGQKRKRGGKGPNNDLHRIVKLVMTRNLNPVIVFSFSKKDCEKYALELKREDYTDEVEKDLISQVYSNAIESLSEDDRKLPQVEALLPLLKRGIGIHHGGLLPILKEIVEILFSEGLIKALFATETFAIGINMPAKTVVFTNTRKWDGKEIRWVTSGEYIQMSGRAGRRGKDDRGVVIQMMDEKMEPTVCKGILYGDPDPLNSSYRISYNMLLNMLRVEDVDPEYLLRASFHQYQQESEAPAMEAQADQAEAEANAIEVVPDGSEEDVAAVGEYVGMDRQLLLTQRKMMKIQRRPEHILPFVQSGGRLVDITIDGENYGWGIIVRYKRKAGTGTAGSAGKTALSTEAPVHNIDILLACVDRHFDDNSPSATARREEDLANLGLLWRGTSSHCRPVSSDDKSNIISMREFTVGLDTIDRISAVRLFVPQDTKPQEARKNIMKSLKEVQRRFPDGLPLLDPVKDLKIDVGEFNKLLQRASELKERLAAHKLTTDVDENERVERVSAYEKKSDLMEQARVLRREAKSCQTMVMKDDLRKMKRVLKELGHVDNQGVIQTKGRTACEINTANELVVVELVFAGVFNDLTVEQSVALLSCLIFDERSNDDDPAQGLKSHLSGPYYKLIELARSVAKVAISCKIELNEDEFVEKFNPGLMEAVYAWCKGVKFVEVQKLTGTFEGSTIRSLRRLEELVRQLASASKSIGNLELQAKFEKGSELLKRDIVFCSSLYL